MYDTLIIGGGIVGAAIATRLCRYDLKIAVLEAERELGIGYNKNKFASIFPEYLSEKNTLKARLCMQGRIKYAETQMNIGYWQIGSILLANTKKQDNTIKDFLEQSIECGAKDVEFLTKKQVMQIEPGVDKDFKHGIYCMGTGITKPYKTLMAFLSHSIYNGVKVFSDSKVCSIVKNKDGFRVKTTNGTVINTKILINAAGYNAPHISEMLGIKTPNVLPNKKEIVFETERTAKTTHYVANLPKERKGTVPNYNEKDFVHIKNIVISRDFLDDIAKEYEKNSKKYYEYLYVLKHLQIRDVHEIIRRHKGFAYLDDDIDYIVEDVRDVPNYYHILNINSFGITAAPAIAHRILGLLAEDGLPLILKPGYKESANAFSHEVLEKSFKEAQLYRIPIL